MADTRPQETNGTVNLKEEPRSPRPSRFSGPSGSRFSGGPRRGGPAGGGPGNDREDRGRPDHFKKEDDQQQNRPGRGRGGGGPGRGGRGGFSGSPHGGNRQIDAGGMPGGPGPREEMNRMRTDDRINEKLIAMSGPTFDIPQKDGNDQKFSSRCRLYVGNLVDVNEEEVKEMFQKYGEVSECFVNPEKMFAFVRLDYRANAERAKRELDGSMRKNRQLKIRFAPVGAAIKVKNLTPWVTNELLEYAFSIFGDIENAQIVVDDRGNSLKEGIVEFARKPSALLALRRCNDGCFLLTNSLRPVIVEPYDVVDDVDGFAEKAIVRKPPEYMKAREVGPRFAQPGTFEYEYGTRWKQLYEMFKQKEEALKRELKIEEEKLEAQMEYAKFEHETELLKEQLRQRELDRERQKMEWEMKERQAEEQRLREEEKLRRHTDELTLRMHHQEDDLRRRQAENNLFIQRQLGDVPPPRGPPVFGDVNGAPQDAVAIREYEALAAAGNLPADPKAFLDVFERNVRFEGRPEEPPARGGSRWGHPGGPDDFPPKRRRY